MFRDVQLRGAAFATVGSQFGTPGAPSSAPAPGPRSSPAAAEQGVVGAGGPRRQRRLSRFVSAFLTQRPHQVERGRSV